MSGICLITGGSGFLGINLIRYLLDNGIKKIRSLDFVPFTYKDAIDEIEIIDGDIRKKSCCRRSYEKCKYCNSYCSSFTSI